MSEIPELPARPARTRPLLAGGLEAVVVQGRRRRQRFLGVAGGTTTGLALALAVVLALPGPSSDSLRQADPPPAPSPSAEPQEAEPSASPAAEPTPDSAASPASGPSARPDEDPTTAPRPAAGPGQQDQEQPQAQAARDPYTEQPKESASVGCAPQPPSGQVGPVFTGGASACSTGSAGASEVPQGGQVSGTYGYCVATGSQPVVLGYATGQEHEVTVFDDSTDELVHRFSETVEYPQGAHERSIAAGRCLSWTGTWDTTGRDGQPAPPGSYRVRIAAVPSTAGGQPVEPGDGGHLEFTVTVTSG